MTFKSPYLLLSPQDGPEKTVSLGNRTLYIGRLPENDVHIQDAASSRRHCKIEPEGDGFRVVDLASSNGTLVNGFKINEKILESSDIIQIGKTKFTYHDPRQKNQQSKSAFLPPEYAHDPEKSRFLAKPSKKPNVEETKGFYLLFQVGRLLVSATDLLPLLDAALALLLDHFGAERGSIAQTREEDLVLVPFVSKITDPVVELAYPLVPSASIVQRVLRERKAILSHDALSDPRFSAEESIIKNKIRSVLCVPLFIQERYFGVLYLDHLGTKQKFKEMDLELLSAAGNLLSVAIVQHEMRAKLEKEALIRTNLERFHSPDVVQTILAKTATQGSLAREVKRLEATILFSDIKGFTSLSEELEPEEMALLLNNYLNKMTQIIFQYRGTVNKFIGDSVMAIFGAPVFYDQTNAAALAIRAAIEMQKGLQLFLHHIAPHKRFQMRIGINTGVVVAGYIGAEKHLEYTVLGDTVNTASRLESLCEPGSILVGERTYQLTRESIQFLPQGKKRVKGKRNAVETFQVLF